MKGIDKIISFWGLCDFGSIGWFVGWRIFHKQIPFYHDVIQANATSTSLGFQLPSFFIYMSIVFYVSLLFSGFLLMKHFKTGAIISYIQCPFRLLFFIPPSIFFITWPVKHIFRHTPTTPEPTFWHPSIILFISLVLLSEIVKTTTVIIWHVKTNKRV